MADAINFDNMTRAELIELRDQLDNAIASASERERQEAIKAVEDLARKHGFSLSELVSDGGDARSGRTKRRGRAAPGSSHVKYRNPENTSQTWSGRGRRPVWFSDALASGRAQTDMEA